MKNKIKLVCVTGASGYIASWIVKLLLDILSEPLFVIFMIRRKRSKLDGAKERLQLFEADLLQEGAFDSATDGCEGVFHTASAVMYDIKDPQVELLDPAVQKLHLSKEWFSLPRWRQFKSTNGLLVLMWWSMKQWYSLSKTLAEDAAWKFMKARGIDMVTINPAVVIGPLLQPTVNSIWFSRCSELKLTQIRPWDGCMLEMSRMPHIQAFEIPTAEGRYCLVESVAHYSEVVGMLAQSCLISARMISTLSQHTRFPRRKPRAWG
ncbi:Phenylacetaldehyde reductase-like protein [Drosera capensis]